MVEHDSDRGRGRGVLKYRLGRIDDDVYMAENWWWIVNEPELMRWMALHDKPKIMRRSWCEEAERMLYGDVGGLFGMGDGVMRQRIRWTVNN